MGVLGTSADGTVSSTPDWLSDGTDGMRADAELKPAEWFKHPIVAAGGLSCETKSWRYTLARGEPEEQCRWMEGDIGNGSGSGSGSGSE